MSLKVELETWAAALEAYDANDYDAALELFTVRPCPHLPLAKANGRLQDIADSSKILFNMGLIYATLGEHELAVEQFHAATDLDQYLAVAFVPAYISALGLPLTAYHSYFQCGVSNFLLSKFDLALVDFEQAFQYLRGNENMFVNSILPLPPFSSSRVPQCIRATWPQLQALRRRGPLQQGSYSDLPRQSPTGARRPRGRAATESHGRARRHRRRDH
jgi:hypothetical protein